MFGSNKRLKKQVTDYFTKSIEKARSGAAIDSMQYASKRMNTLGDVSGKQNKKTLLEIRDLQYDVDEALVKDNINTLETVSGQVMERISKLSIIKPKNRRVKVGSAFEIIMRTLANAQDEYNQLESLLQKARERAKHEPDNVVVRAEVGVLEIKAKNVKRIMDYLESETQRESLIDAVDQLKKSQKMILATASATDEEFNVITDELNKTVEEMERRKRKTKDVKDDFTGTSARTSTTAEDQTANAYTSSAQKASAAAEQPVSTAVGASTGIFGAAVGSEPVPTGTPQEQLEAILKNIDPDELSVDFARYIQKLDEQINYYDAYAKKFAEELRPLLEARKSASPIECLTLDSKISSLSNKYETAKRALLRYLNEKTNAEKRLRIVESLRIESRLSDSQIEEIVEGYKVFDSNIENIAMVISDISKAANSGLERLGTAIDVMEAPEINIDSSTSDIYKSFDSLQKDNDKFADLEHELGLR